MTSDFFTGKTQATFRSFEAVSRRGTYFQTWLLFHEPLPCHFFCLASWKKITSTIFGYFSPFFCPPWGCIRESNNRRGWEDDDRCSFWAKSEEVKLDISLHPKQKAIKNLSVLILRGYMNKYKITYAVSPQISRWLLRYNLHNRWF